MIRVVSLLLLLLTTFPVMAGMRVASSAVCADQTVMVSLPGPNGAGRGTLIKAHGCPAVGKRYRLYLDGQPLRDLTFLKRARRIAYLPQSIVVLGRLPHGGTWSGQYERLRTRDGKVDDVADGPCAQLRPSRWPTLPDCSIRWQTGTGAASPCPSCGSIRLAG